MKKMMHTITYVLLLLTFITLFAYFNNPTDFLFSLLITFITTSYHFVMRLIVGNVIDAVMKNNANYNHRWFKTLKMEDKIYKLIKVSKWKEHMPTYFPDSFSLKHHTLDEIAMSMCQSEIVHEVIVVLSFVPVFAIPYLGAAALFIITSFLAACFDMCFVIMQRYNRPRIIKLIEKRKIRKS